MNTQIKNQEGDDELQELIHQVVVSGILCEQEKVELFRKAMRIIEEDRQSRRGEMKV